MTIAAPAAPRRLRAPAGPWPWIWAAAIAAVVAVHVFRGGVAWAVDMPDEWLVPAADWINVVFDWINNNFHWLTRDITKVLGVQLDFALNLLAKGFKIGPDPGAFVSPYFSPLDRTWSLMIVGALLIGRAAGRIRLGLLAAACLLYAAVFGHWTGSLFTHALFLVFGDGGRIVILPRLSWLGICIAAYFAGRAAGGNRLGLLISGCFFFVALFGKWTSSMLTLGLIIIAVPVCIVLGALIGIWAWKRPWVDKFLVSPLLDLMQTIPTFAYLIPMLLLFGNSPVSAMLATAIFAMPPMVRATMLGLSRVPSEIKDFGDMAGCTPRQKLWRVMLPSARPSLMIGVNQVIMLALNMVIISSMIGAGGLGYDVLLGLRALRIGDAMEAGLAIVALAIALDRLSQAMAQRTAAAKVHVETKPPFLKRYPNLVAALAILIVTTLIGLVEPGLHHVPKAITFTTGPFWKWSIKWVNIHFYDAIETFRVVLIIYILRPVRQFCTDFPWTGAVLMLGLIGYRLGGWRLAALAAILTTYCAAVGLWDKTMATVYLCGISAVISCLIGIPLGLYAARNDRFEKIITPLLDTLQTLPSFCFIIPVVMLFRVGDVSAMIATVAFAVVPAVRYTNHGIRQVPPALIEAATVSGCTRRQLFWKVELPIALPEIMLGVNQTILMALAMIIICAMIGTRDLGQEVFIALAKANAGRGIVAGLAIAFIGITADRLFSAWSARARARVM